MCTGLSLCTFGKCLDGVSMTGGERPQQVYRGHDEPRVPQVRTPWWARFLAPLWALSPAVVVVAFWGFWVGTGLALLSPVPGRPAWVCLFLSCVGFSVVTTSIPLHRVAVRRGYTMAGTGNAWPVGCVMGWSLTFTLKLLVLGMRHGG